MDEFQFKPNGATLSGELRVPDIDGESQFEIFNLNAIWGTNGTAKTIEPKLPSDVPGLEPGTVVVTFEDPLFG